MSCERQPLFESIFFIILRIRIYYIEHTQNQQILRKMQIDEESGHWDESTPKQAAQYSAKTEV